MPCNFYDIIKGKVLFPFIVQKLLLIHCFARFKKNSPFWGLIEKNLLLH